MYTTNDLYLAAALQQQGHKLHGVWRMGSRSDFEFEEDDALPATIAGYFGGALALPAHAFAERIRSAKSMAVNAQAKKAE